MAATAPEIAGRLGGLAKNLDRLFLPLSAMIDAYMVEVCANKPNPRLKEVFDHVVASFSDEAYREIQDAHLSTEALQYILDAKWPSPEIKYLDFPFWATSKINTAHRLGLKKSTGLKILDIGAGPGHFGLVCDVLQHRYLGLDVPMRAMVPGTRAHVFDDLFTFFRSAKISQRIEAGVPLRLDDRFDLVTCFMGTFNTIRSEGGRLVRPWNWEEWSFFLRDLLDRHTTPDARMYFHISRDYLPPAVWERIEETAIEHNATSNVFVFDRTLAQKI